MKLKFEIPDELIAQIATEVVRRLSIHKKQDEIFTPETLAEYLNVEVSWVYKQIHARRIPFFKAGKYIRFKRSEIDRWIEGNTEIPESNILKIEHYLKSRVKQK